MARAATSVDRDARELILRAALDSFAANGFDGTKTRDIAARAGVTLGLLQYYFGNKTNLWRAAVDRAFAELRSGLEAILNDPQMTGEADKLRRLIRSHTRFVASRPEFVRLMHEEGKRRGPRMRWLVDRHVKPLYDLIVPLIRHAQMRGVVPRNVSPVHLVYALIGAIGVIFHQAEECRRATGIDPTDDAVVEAHAHTVELLFLGPDKSSVE